MLTITGSIISGIVGSGFLVFVFRRQNQQIDNQKEEIKSMCAARCGQIRDELRKGSDEFRYIKKDLSDLGKTINEQAVILARLDERLTAAQKRLNGNPI